MSKEDRIKYGNRKLCKTPDTTRQSVFLRAALKRFKSPKAALREIDARQGKSECEK